jgi:hypothetical protein
MHGQGFEGVCRKRVLAEISYLLGLIQRRLRCVSEFAALSLFIVSTNIKADFGKVQGHRQCRSRRTRFALPTFVAGHSSPQAAT